MVDYPDEASVYDDFENTGDFVIRYKSFSFKPMSVDEAVLQMNLLGHDFYVFENDVTGKVNVVYKRRNNEYGCIVQET